MSRKTKSSQKIKHKLTTVLALNLVDNSIHSYGNFLVYSMLTTINFFLYSARLSMPLAVVQHTGSCNESSNSTFHLKHTVYR